MADPVDNYAVMLDGLKTLYQDVQDKKMALKKLQTEQDLLVQVADAKPRV